MAISVLTIIFFAAGFMAMLYGIVAGLSMLKYMQVQKSLPDKLESSGGEPVAVGPPEAEAFCSRARLFLKRQRFDAALADCKRAIDLNPNHAVAHTLWELALEKEIPPEPVPEELPAEAKPAPKKKLPLKKQRKVAKPPPAKVKDKKKPAERSAEEILILEPEPEETAPPAAVEKTPVETEAMPADIDIAKKELVLEEVPAEEPAVALEPAEVSPEVEEEPVVGEEIPPQETPVVEAKVTVEEPAEAPPEVEEEPVVAEEVPPAEAPEVEEKAAVEEPSGEEVPVLKDRVPSEKPRGESPLEEIDHEQLREHERGEATAADAEWTQYADNEGPELAESKIRMHELPTEATGLKETIIDLKQAEAYNLQGETSISRKQYDNAIKDFTRAININPKFVDALINRGGAYAQLGRFNDALGDFNDALKYEKKDAGLYNKRGEIFLQNDLYDQAIKDFSSAIVLNPMFSDAFLNRGRAYSEKGMPEEAMNDFNHAIKADSDHADIHLFDRAAPSIQEDTESKADRGEAESLNQQGVVNMEKELYEEAIKNFTQAINLQTTFADAYINRGRIYTLQKEINLAVADFNQAVMFDPLNAEIYYWRSQAWKEKGDAYNLSEDLKLACEMGHEGACLEYKNLKSAKK